MFPQKFHIIPMLNDSVFDWISKFEHTSFACIDVITHINFRLVASAGNDNIILGSSDAELKIMYTDGMM